MGERGGCCEQAPQQTAGAGPALAGLSESSVDNRGRSSPPPALGVARRLPSWAGGAWPEPDARSPAAAGGALDAAAKALEHAAEPSGSSSCGGGGDAPAADAASALAGLAWPPRQQFDYLVVVDFESTCNNRPGLRPTEIIEFPSVLVDLAALRVVDTWRAYVRPVMHPRLTSFCMNLTGVQQHQVDAGVRLEQALRLHDKWLASRGVLGRPFAVATWSDWDCKVMLEAECAWKGIRKPAYFERWINLREPFQKVFGARTRGNLQACMALAGLTWRGRPHCGLDDAANTARLALSLIHRGAVLAITGSFRRHDDTGGPQADLGPVRKRALHADRGKDISWAYTKRGALRRGGSATQVACYCQVRAQARTVQKPGPTLGCDFLSCGRWTATGGGTCHFFQWLSPAAAPM
eukprot:SM000190S04865  [mRNA]  locus=s190:239755:241585:+ [translate_table: standard]